MVRDKWAVRLAPEQREEVQHLIRAGKSSARVSARARILLKSDDGWPAPQVAEALGGPGHGVPDQAVLPRNRALGDRGAGPSVPEAGRPGRGPPGGAGLQAPEGHDHLTLRLLAGKVVELGLAPALSHETVRLRLKKTSSSRGRKRSGAFPG